MTNQKRRTILKTFRVERVLEESKLYDVPNNGIIRSPQDIAEVFETVFNTKSMTKEHLLMLSLNTKNKVIALHVVHIGSVNASIVHPRDIFQLAILDNATSIAIAHNHPSGDTTPSEEDINVTNRINEAGKLMGIELLDHIILGDSYLSLKEKGYL